MTRWASAVVLGLALAMSSTAVVLQVLSDRRELGGPLGRAALGVLLFQDIAAVPILVAVGVLGQGGEAQGVAALAWMAVRAVATVLALLLAGRLVLRPLFRSVARTASPDLFVAACLLVVLGTSLIAAGLALFVLAVGLEKVRALLGWLRTLPFVEAADLHVQVHDLVRESFAAAWAARITASEPV